MPWIEIKPSADEMPEPTVLTPSMDELMEMEAEGGCEATDGCWVEPDGVCPHGHVSWLIYLGLI